jgi:hypothetical protein
MIKRRVICFHKVEDYVNDKVSEIEAKSSVTEIDHGMLLALKDLWNTLKGELEELEVPDGSDQKTTP